jgi:hypothetical protein
MADLRLAVMWCVRLMLFLVHQTVARCHAASLPRRCVMSRCPCRGASISGAIALGTARPADFPAYGFGSPAAGGGAIKSLTDGGQETAPPLPVIAVRFRSF